MSGEDALSRLMAEVSGGGIAGLSAGAAARARERRPGCVNAGVEADRPDWPEWWLGRGDALTDARCRAFWSAALIVSLRDSLENEARRREGLREFLHQDMAPASWWRSRHFCDVADLAGFDGAALQQRLERLIAARGLVAVIKMLNGSARRRYGRGRAL